MIMLIRFLSCEHQPESILKSHFEVHLSHIWELPNAQNKNSNYSTIYHHIVVFASFFLFFSGCMADNGGKNDTKTLPITDVLHRMITISERLRNIAVRGSDFLCYMGDQFYETTRRKTLKFDFLKHFHYTLKSRKI